MSLYKSKITDGWLYDKNGKEIGFWLQEKRINSRHIGLAKISQKQKGDFFLKENWVPQPSGISKWNQLERYLQEMSSAVVLFWFS